MKLTEKQMIDLISEELEEMFAPGADGEEYEPEGPKPMEVLSEYKELMRLLNSEPQEYRKKQTYLQANKVLSMIMELSGLEPIFKRSMKEQKTLSGDPKANALRAAIVDLLDSSQFANPSKTVMAIVNEVIEEYKQGLMGGSALGFGGSFFESKELRIDAPDETLDLEIKHIRMGYKERHGKEPNFEEFKEYYKQHSQVNQNVVDRAKETVYKDAEGQLDEMPRRNPKTGEPMGPEAQKLYSMRRPYVGRARGAYKSKDVDTGAIVQGAIANLLRDNPDVTLSVSAEDAAAIQNDPNIDKAIKDRLITPKQ